jgi:hypothetical protein
MRIREKTYNIQSMGIINIVLSIETVGIMKKLLCYYNAAANLRNKKLN